MEIKYVSWIITAADFLTLPHHRKILLGTFSLFPLTMFFFIHLRSLLLISLAYLLIEASVN
jgi:hypothetical protein